MRWRTALVTGASSGIGRECARLLAGRGLDVVAVARRRAELEALADEVGSVEVLTADLTEPADLRAVERRIGDPQRPIDLVVNNAGTGGHGVFQELAIDRQEAQVRLNVLAVMRLSHAALAAMVPRGRGGLLNVSSVASFQPLPGTATYAAGKAFVTSLSEALHEQVRGSGVHVTALCPGFTRTEFHGAGGVDRDGIPGFAWLSAADVAAAGLTAVARNQAVCIPGWGYRALVAGERLMPRAALRRLTALLNGT